VLSALLADGPEAGKSGPLGLLTIVALGVAVYFLYRSMNRHMKKVPASFDPPAEPDPAPDAAPAADPGKTEDDGANGWAGHGSAPPAG
jgi:hypothetical protein